MSCFSDDITFCPLDCDNTDCMRNSKNIRDRTIPHSYSIEVPDDCPKNKQCAESSVKQEDIAEIMNRINDAINDIGYVAVGYDNTDSFLIVTIDKE